MKLWTRSCVAGIRRVSRRQLRDLQDYLGAELGFYFSWASFYTRYLWAPAALGLVTYIAQTQLELRIDDEARLASNASSTEELGSGASGSDRLIGGLLGNASAAGEPSAERGGGGSRASWALVTGLYRGVWGGFGLTCPVTLFLSINKGAIPTHFLTQQTVHFFSRKTKFFV